MGTLRKRQKLSKDETLLIFNAAMDVMRDQFLMAVENFDYDIVSYMEAFGRGSTEPKIVTNSLDKGAKNVGLSKELREEMHLLAKALINDPDMGGLSYEKIDTLNTLVEAVEKAEECRDKLRGL